VPEDDGVYGLLQLAGADVALPLEALREVVPCPEGFDDLPVSARGLLGAMDLRSLVLPVVDPRLVLDRPEQPRHSGQVVVVAAHGGRALGLLADRVVGVARLPRSALQPVVVRPDGSAPPLFSQTFRHPDDGRIISVVDAAAVLDLPGVPTAQDRAPSSAGTTVRRPGRTFTLLQCGAYRLALPVEAVHTTLSAPGVRPFVVDSALCRGVTDFADREVPVIDPLVLLGLGVMRDDEVQAGLVLDLGHGYVVLALSGLLNLTELAEDDVLPVPGFAVARADLVAGLADVDGLGACFVLDEVAVEAEPDLVALSAVNTALEGGELPAPGDAHAATSAGPSYLTFAAGATLVAPLEQVVEILPLPASLTDTAVGGAVRGVVVHRRAAVPVLCLAQLLGRVPAVRTAASCLLLVEVDGVQVAFAVDALHGIDPLAWTDPEHAPDDVPPGPERSLRACRLVQVGDRSDLLPELDLHALARSARGSQVVVPRQDAPDRTPVSTG
jgi:purine-binding chemotaxis protein CheW